MLGLLPPQYQLLQSDTSQSAVLINIYNVLGLLFKVMTGEKQYLYKRCLYLSLSINIADAPPPPLQITANPSLALFCFTTFIRVVVIRAPEDPIG